MDQSINRRFSLGADYIEKRAQQRENAHKTAKRILSYLESIVDLGIGHGFVDEALVDGEGIGVDVGEKSARNFGGILGVFVEEETVVNADFARKRIGYLGEIIRRMNQ